MKFQQEYDCTKCQYSCSHPIDRCPVCGDQFYWLVIPRIALSEEQRDAFLSAMMAMSGDETGIEFLTFGDHLWLPHNFWVKDHGGDCLKVFSWIDEIKLYQHEAASSPAGASGAAKGVPVRETARPGAYADRGTKRIPGLGKTLMVKNPLDQRAEPAAKTPVAAEAVDSGVGATGPGRGWFAGKQGLLAPVMVFWLFLWLSAAYFVLLYHKNQREPAPATPAEVAHEREVLP